MNRITFLLIAVLVTTATTYGVTYLPMIEEGNEYEYGFHYKYGKTYTLKIEEDSVYNGKVYKKCVWHAVFKDIYTDAITDTTFQRGLIREHDGKVWMLYDPNPRPWLPHSYGSYTQEFLIYDMSLTPGEDIQIMPDDMDYSTGNPGDLWRHRQGKHRLLETKYINLNNSKRLVQTFAISYQSAEEEPFKTVDIIEGIGMPETLLLFPYTIGELASDDTPPELLVKRNAKGEIEYMRGWLGTPNVYNNRIKVIGGDNLISIEGDYSSYSVTDISGRRWNTLKVPAGLYIVTVDGHPHKVKVK